MADAELDIVVKMKDLFSKQLDGVVSHTGKSAKAMESSWASLSKGITAAKVAVGAWITGQAAQFIRSTAELAAKVDLANTAFGSMAKRINLDVKTALADMRTASRGTVSDLDLMASANKAIMLGAVKTSDELKNLIYYGSKLGNAMGLDASQGIEYFTTGLARQLAAILDNVGLIIDMEAEYKRLGKTAADLTEDERRSIFASAVWRTAREGAESLGTQIAKTAEGVQRMDAAWRNFKAQMATFSAPAIEKIAALVAQINAFEERLRSTSTPSVSGSLSAPGMLAPVPGGGGLIPQLDFLKQPNQLFYGRDANGQLVPLQPQANYGPVSPTELGAIQDYARSQAMQGEYDWWQYSSRYGIPKTQTYQERDMAWENVQRAQAASANAASYMDRVWSAMADGASRYYQTIADTMALVSSCVYRTFQDIEVNLGDVFFDAMMGKMKTFKEYLRAFIQDIARTLSQFFARKTVAALIEAGGSAIGGLFGGSSSVASVGGGENYFIGGGMSLPAGQSGGITRGPTIAGEAGAEAIVPLPGNRKIPVDLRGGAGGATVFVFQVQAVDAPSVQRLFYEQGGTLAKVLQERLSIDMQLRAAVRAV